MPTAENLAVRDATPEDAAVIADIYNESILAADCTMDDVPRTPADIAGQMSHFGSREGYLLLERDGEVIGWAVIKRYSDRGGYRFTAETSTYLRRAERFQGYGTFLKERLLARCRAFGYHHLVARIWARNKTSIAYNEKFGYQLVGIQREIGFRNGRWEDVAIMQLVLDAVAPRSSPGVAADD